VKKLLPALALLALVLASSAIVASSQAADYTKIGVKAGDYMEYYAQLSHSGYDRMKLEVTKVNGVILNVTSSGYWSNGTVLWSNPDSGNVSTGYFDFLLCAGLQRGDPPYAGSPDHFNDTLQMDIAGATRTVNELPLGDSVWYFDQASGFMVKAIGPAGSDNFTAISTNLWGQVNPTVVVLIVGATVAVVLVGVAAILLRRRAK
jgi:major membrane immunogen (membrane-anchored lipoprotein)